MQAPHEDQPQGTPTSAPPPAPAVVASAWKVQAGTGSEARAVRWGATALALVLGGGLLITMTMALAGPWSWLWVPWAIGAVPVAAFSASTWKKFIEAEEAATRHDREWRNRAARVSRVSTTDNPDWGS